jgi:putative membrane protein insertion efficiency factor
MIRYLWLGPRWLLIFAVLVIVWAYRVVVRPFLPPACRFEPSCSEYMIQSVRKYGPILGVCRGVRRISQCHPWNAGGYDPP